MSFATQNNHGGNQWDSWRSNAFHWFLLARRNCAGWRCRYCPDSGKKMKHPPKMDIALLKRIGPFLSWAKKK